MVGPDSFYTPQPLADKLASYISEKNIKSAIDFCIGDGDLLKAVQHRFKGIKYYGTDISDEAIAKIQKENCEWTLGICDFRSDESINKLSFLRKRKFDLIMFNPPFTCKGSNIERITFDGNDFKVSTAMLFVLKAMNYLSPGGGMYAILPISCVYSQKDRVAWNYLKSKYNACILEEPKRYYFHSKCSPNIVLVYIGSNYKEGITLKKYADFSKLPVNDIVRGSLRMQNLDYSKSKKALRLIHTTNLQNGKLYKLKRVIPSSHLIVGGFGVVIPRVCNPNPNKIVVVDGDKTYVLSDCVIFLKTDTMADAENVKDYILNHWQSFIEIYKGTGAQYTTMERVKTLFGK